MGLLQGTSPEPQVTTGQPSPTCHSPTRSEQGWVVAGPMDSPRQSEVTNQGQGLLNQAQRKKRQPKTAIEATCSISPKSIWTTGLDINLPATFVQGPSKRPRERQGCSKDLWYGSGVHSGRQQGPVPETGTPPTQLKRTWGSQLK